MRIRFKTGADPEVFVLDQNTGTVVPAYKLTQGTKEKPTKTRRGGVLADNVMMEFNPTPQPSVSATNSVMSAMMDELADRRNFYDRALMFSAVPTMTITAAVAKEEKANVFGCDPDFDAYMQGATRKTPAPEPLVRCGAGHIHIGMDPKPDIPDHILAQLCDLTYGLAAVAAGEQQQGRRQRYGLAGIYRPKPYGIEYRTLSNMWVRDYGLLINLANAEEAFRELLTMSMGKIQKLYSVTDWMRVKAAIDGESREEALALREMSAGSIGLLKRAA